MDWGGIISGAALGVTKGALQHIQDEEDARRKLAMEEHRSRIEEQRQMRLYEFQAKMAEKTKLDDINGPVGQARQEAERKKRDEQFAFDTDPKNAEAKARAAGIIAENTPFELSPGEERHVNGKVIKNSTPTSAEITRDLYEKGYRGLDSKDKDNLPPGYVTGMREFAKDDDELAKQINALRVKMIEADPDKQKAFDAEIGRLTQERLAVRDNRMALAIEHGQLDANAHARHLAPQIKSLDQLNSVVQGSYKKFGHEWGEKIEQGLLKAGVFHRLEADMKNNAQGKTATDWGGRPGTVGPTTETPPAKPEPTGILGRSLNLLEGAWEANKANADRNYAERQRGGAERSTEITPDTIRSMSKDEAARTLMNDGYRLTPDVRELLTRRINQ